MDDDEKREVVARAHAAVEQAWALCADSRAIRLEASERAHLLGRSPPQPQAAVARGYEADDRETMERVLTRGASASERLGRGGVIGEARRLVMARRGCGPQEALEVLRAESRRQEVSLRDVAARLLARARPAPSA